MIRRLLITGFLVATAFHGAGAQATPEQRELLLIESTPIGALPPIALPMPASRNHNYWGFRLQTGRREGPGDEGIPAVAAGIDFQYRGGSTIGITGGYQKRDCGLTGPIVVGIRFLEIRSRLNVLTGGQSLGSLFNDPSRRRRLGGSWASVTRLMCSAVQTRARSISECLLRSHLASAFESRRFSLPV